MFHFSKKKNFSRGSILATNTGACQLCERKLDEPPYKKYLLILSVCFGLYLFKYLLHFNMPDGCMMASTAAIIVASLFFGYIAMKRLLNMFTHRAVLEEISLNRDPTEKSETCSKIRDFIEKMNSIGDQNSITRDLKTNLKNVRNSDIESEPSYMTSEVMESTRPEAELAAIHDSHENQQMRELFADYEEMVDKYLYAFPNDRVFDKYLDLD